MSTTSSQRMTSYDDVSTVEASLCSRKCKFIFVKGFAYADADFKGLGDKLPSILGIEAKIFTFEFEVIDLDENATGKIQKEILSANTCSDGITRVIFCFEEGVSFVDETLKRIWKKMHKKAELPEKVVTGLKNSLAVFACHDGENYARINDDIAKISYNIELTNSKESTGFVMSGTGVGAIRSIRVYTEKSRYNMKHYLESEDVVKIIKQMLKLEETNSSFCAHHSTESTSSKGSHSTSDQPSTSKNSLEPKKQAVIGSTKYIFGEQGGCIDVGNCEIDVPSGSVPPALCNTEFQFIVSHFNTRIDNGFPITPIIQCSPNVKFLKPVRIRLCTWCSTESDEVQAVVLYQNNREDRPSELKSISLKGNEGCIEFETWHFTWFWAYIKRIFFAETLFRTVPTIYYSVAHGNIEVVFHLNKQHPVHLGAGDLIQASVLLDPIIIKPGEHIPVFLQCQDPQCTIIPENGQMLLLDEDFANELHRTLNFMSDPIPALGKNIKIKCKIRDRDTVFRLTWINPGEAQGPSRVYNISNVEYLQNT